jgi:hypothetical protein
VNVISLDMSTTLKPVTHTALIEVNREARSGGLLNCSLNPSRKRQKVPTMMRMRKVRVTCRAGFNLIALLFSNEN